MQLNFHLDSELCAMFVQWTVGNKHAPLHGDYKHNMYY